MAIKKTLDPVTKYAEEVVAGKRIAGKFVRDQCARHLKDKKNKDFVWDITLANKAIGFFNDVLKLNGGDFEGKPFDLLPWQKFVVGSLFGWLGKDGYRRFRNAYVETAKGPLALDTKIPTPSGWTTMGELQPGDFVFDDQGNPTKVTAISPVFHNHDCFKLTFSDGVEIVADGEHRWPTIANGSQWKLTTEQIAATLMWNHHTAGLTIVGCDSVPSVPVKCITVEAESHLFLVSESLIPTANSGKSPLAAGVGMTGLVADSEPRAEVYSAAPLALDTLVPTPEGWTTQGQLKVGDRVFDENGKPCAVTYLSPILENKECFEVEFDDGTIIVSDANHLWQTVDTRGQSPTHYPTAVVTTEQISKTLRAPGGRLRHRISVAGVLQLPEVELPIDPYTLGVWLGDGRSNGGAMCYHKDDIQHLDCIRAAGYEISSMGSQNDTRYCTIRGLRTQLRLLGLLNNKHVPTVYLRASYEQRIALLSGLMDTDGTCTKTGECRFTNRERRLVEAAHELATGLGIRSSFREIEVTGSPYWCVSFKAPKSLRVFNLNRKFARQRDSVDKRATGRYICDVRPCKSVPVRCIEVDSENHLYLVTRSHIATHNTKKDQAMILFRDAVAMVDQSPELAKRLVKSGTGERCWNLAYIAQGAFFRPISSDDGQSGPRPHIGLIDELHEHKDNKVVEMMRAGTKSRRQALIFMITNSGSSRHGPCWGYHEYGAKVASGELTDDAFFPYICGLDEGDDPFADETCWPKANPSLQDANLPGYKYIREQVVEAKGMPSKEAIVRRLNFCQWTDAEAPWLSHEIWTAAKQDYDIESLRGRRAVAGLDLSSTTDLTGLVFLVEPKDDDEPWKLVPFAWLPDDGLDRKSTNDRVPYLEWLSQGYLSTTPGKAISKRVILQKLSAMCDFFEVTAVAYDRWRMEDLISLANDDGISLPELKPFGQGYKDMSPAIETFERMLLNGEIAHNGHKLLTMCAGNAVTDSDGAGNRKLDKSAASGRIDLVVCAVMAAGLVQQCNSGRSFWESA